MEVRFEGAEALLVVAHLDQLGADGREARKRPVARDGVLEGERLDRRRLEKGLVVLDRPQPAESEDRADGLLLPPVQTAQPSSLGRLLGGLGGVPEAERLLAAAGSLDTAARWASRTCTRALPSPSSGTQIERARR